MHTIRTDWLQYPVSRIPEFDRKWNDLIGGDVPPEAGAMEWREILRRKLTGADLPERKHVLRRLIEELSDVKETADEFDSEDWRRELLCFEEFILFEIQRLEFVEGIDGINQDTRWMILMAQDLTVSEPGKYLPRKGAALSKALTEIIGKRFELSAKAVKDRLRPHTHLINL